MRETDTFISCVFDFQIDTIKKYEQSSLKHNIIVYE